MKRKGKMKYFCLQRRFNSSKNIVSAVVRGLIGALTYLKNRVSAPLNFKRATQRPAHAVAQRHAAEASDAAYPRGKEGGTQRPVPMRLRQEIQELPRPSGRRSRIRIKEVFFMIFVEGRLLAGGLSHYARKA